jgi:tryptophanase
MKTIIEPFKVKVVEPIKMITRDEREGYLQLQRGREGKVREAGRPGFHHD